jgi:hypothetical protein
MVARLGFAIATDINIVLFDDSSQNFRIFDYFGNLKPIK